MQQCHYEYTRGCQLHQLYQHATEGNQGNIGLGDQRTKGFAGDMRDAFQLFGKID